MSDYRRFLLAGLIAACLATGCDAVHMKRITLLPAQAGARADMDAVDVVRSVLRDHGFSDKNLNRLGSEEWGWRDTAKPPGVRVQISSSVEGLSLRVSQDLHGSVGKTETFQTIVGALTEALRSRHGKARVRVN